MSTFSPLDHVKVKCLISINQYTFYIDVSHLWLLCEMTTKNCVNGPKLVLKDLCEKSFVRNDQLPSEAVKLQSIWVELCSWSYAGSWITGGSWTDKGWGASCTTDNHKSTDTCKPSQADKMQVQDVWLLAILLLQQHRTCLHRRVLLHGRRWRMWEPP